ncbi:unnamed protein product [Eruca vesicaria subsp. sativa]|uniref:Uncharacterized protein n=1 Tax=Eruca vesicaria subsp. sativa TaxID=29727 RepID=A0ABC8KBC0_ERUVS|nr:unnamed protein product [Eruca vesicaria subsp. sativa]
MSPFLTRSIKSKFVISPPANVKETILNKNPILCSKKENPVQYEAVSEVVVKPGSSVNIKISASEIVEDLFFLHGFTNESRN